MSRFASALQMFARKYQRIAAEHAEEGAVFLEILGDESADTRVSYSSFHLLAFVPKEDILVHLCHAFGFDCCKTAGIGYPCSRLPEYCVADMCCVLVLQKLMISMQIRVTPTFCLYRNKEQVKTVTGVNVENLQNAVKQELQQLHQAQEGQLP
jgi:hypothetical protein